MNNEYQRVNTCVKCREGLEGRSVQSYPLCYESQRLGLPQRDMDRRSRMAVLEEFDS